MLTWHRSITHSLLCLPVWTVILAGLTIVVAKWRKVGSALLPCAMWYLGNRNPEPHLPGSGDHLRYDDLVAARMVAARLGHYFHRSISASRPSC